MYKFPFHPLLNLSLSVYVFYVINRTVEGTGSFLLLRFFMNSCGENMKSKTLTLLFVVTLIQQLDIFTHKGNRTWVSRGGFAYCVFVVFKDADRPNACSICHQRRFINSKVSVC